MMEEVANNIFIEQSYPGVVLGVLKLKHGVMMVDAPFRSEDQISWHAKLVCLGGRVEHLLVMLDTHVDRTLGIRAMETNVLGHEKAVEIMQNRPTTARGQDIDAGADWEPYNLPISIRWAVPDLTYSDQVTIYWDDAPIVITHQPGSHYAGSWLRYAAEKILFVGDCVVLGQPPFLAWSDLDRWLQDLAWLGSDEFKGYKIISSRNGVVTKRSVEKMAHLISKIKEVVEELAGKSNRMEEIILAVPPLLKKLNFDKALKKLYENRLIWGLEQYLRRHYPEKSDSSLGANK